MDDDQAAERLKEADSAYPGLPPIGPWGALPQQADEQLLDLLQALDVIRAESSPGAVQEAVNVASRAAATDTGAIEGLYEVDRGFTMSVATQAASWETLLQGKGDVARDLIKAQLTTYELVLDLGTQREPISEAVIRRLHEEITLPQEKYVVQTDIGFQEQPLPHGEYKRFPNHVIQGDGSIFSYAPVEDTPGEMHKLVSAIASPEFEAASPVVQAAYAHYGLVRIHPFADGNGRVARALASVYLYRAASIPFLLLQDQKTSYLLALAEADQARPEALVSFFRRRAVEAVHLVKETLEASASPSPSETLARLGQLYLAHGELRYEQLDQLGLALMGTLHEEAGQVVGSLEQPPGVNIKLAQADGSMGSEQGFRATINVNSLRTRVLTSTTAPAQASVAFDVGVLVANEVTEARAFLVVSSRSESLEVPLDEVNPEPTLALRLLLRTWLQRQTADALAELLAAAEVALRNTGYVK